MLVEQNGYSGDNSFRKVTRLVKYMRDIKESFTCSSVLLTTLLGHCVSSVDKGSASFSDLPTAFRTVFGRLDDILQKYPQKPGVPNPFLETEDFASAWKTEEQYTNFRDKIQTYRGWIDEAFNEQNRIESIANWRRVFGDEFAKGVVVNEGKSVGSLVVADMRMRLVEASQFAGDLVEAIKRYGGNILPASFNRQPYMEAPRWRKAPANQQMSVSVRADLHRHKLGTQPVGAVQSLQPLQPGYWLHFKAVTNTGLPFDPAHYAVHWRVTNTDQAAAAERALRGKIEKPESDNRRWEELKYRGVHLAEAFIVSKRTDQIVGQSEPFRVMIE